MEQRRSASGAGSGSRSGPPSGPRSRSGSSGSGPRSGAGSRSGPRSRPGSPFAPASPPASRRSARTLGENASPLESAKALALRVLAYHARSEAQLRARLSRAGFDAEADEVLAWARRLGYLDDAAYARARAGALLAGGRVGPRRAELRLRAAGIDPASARAAVAAAADERSAERRDGDTPELALCREALARRLRGRELGALDARERARLARFLLGRGFSPGTVGRLVRLDDLG